MIQCYEWVNIFLLFEYYITHKYIYAFTFPCIVHLHLAEKSWLIPCYTKWFAVLYICQACIMIYNGLWWLCNFKKRAAIVNFLVHSFFLNANIYFLFNVSSVTRCIHVRIKFIVLVIAKSFKFFLVRSIFNQNLRVQQTNKQNQTLKMLILRLFIIWLCIHGMIL